MLGAPQMEKCQDTEHGTRTAQRAGECPVDVGARDLIEADDKRADAGTAENEAEKIERAAFFGAMIFHDRKHEREAHDADRNIEEEDVATRCERRDEAADRRPEHRRDQARRRDELREPDELAFVAIAKDDEPAHRHHHRSADALQHACGGEFPKRIRRTAENRCDGEDDDRRCKDRLRSEPVGHPAARWNEHRQREQIRRHAEAEVGGPLVERLRDFRQRRRDDRAVEHFHEERARDDEREQRGTVLGGEETANEQQLRLEEFEPKALAVAHGAPGDRRDEVRRK